MCGVVAVIGKQNASELVIEGLKTLKVVKELSDEHEVEMPIVDSLFKIIYKGDSLDGSIQKVLGKDMIKDVEFIK